MLRDEDIESFCSYFERQVKVIDSIKLDTDVIEQTDPSDFQILLYKKTSLVTMLDAMAGLRFPKKYYPEMKNQKRFTRFVEDYANWDIGKLISVPFLSDCLTSSKFSKNKLAKYLKSKLSGFDPLAGGTVAACEMDERHKVLLSFAKMESEEREILECQHYAILYRYRNYLVHEARIPGYSMEVYQETDAHYHSYSNDQRWFLVYPLALLKALCSQCIRGLKQHLIDHQIDPDEIIKDTSRF